MKAFSKVPNAWNETPIGYDHPNSILLQAMKKKNDDLKETLVMLFYLMANIDGEVNHRGLAIGRKMAGIENIKHAKLETWLALYNKQSPIELLNACREKLRILSYEQQAYCLAWVSVFAKSDGYIAKNEHKLINILLTTDLQVSIQDTVDIQKSILEKVGANFT